MHRGRQFPDTHAVTPAEGQYDAIQITFTINTPPQNGHSKKEDYYSLPTE